MKRQLITGEIVRISPCVMVERTDGVWGDWKCEVEKADGSTYEAYIEGDGHLFHFESFKDENGNHIVNYPPSDNFTPPNPRNKFMVCGITMHQMIELDENGIRIT